MSTPKALKVIKHACKLHVHEFHELHKLHELHEANDLSLLYNACGVYICSGLVAVKISVVVVYFYEVHVAYANEA